MKTCLKLFQNYFRSFLQLVNIFQHAQCCWNNFEIISASEIIVFQFQTWLRVKWSTEIILKLFRCFISHVTMHGRQTRIVAICLCLHRRFESWLGIVAYGLGQATYTCVPLSPSRTAIMSTVTSLCLNITQEAYPLILHHTSNHLPIIIPVFAHLLLFHCLPLQATFTFVASLSFNVIIVQ